MARLSQNPEEAAHVLAILLKVAKTYGQQVTVTTKDGAKIVGQIAQTGIKTEGNAHKGYFEIRDAKRDIHEIDVLDVSDIVQSST